MVPQDGLPLLAPSQLSQLVVNRAKRTGARVSVGCVPCQRDGQPQAAVHRCACVLWAATGATGCLAVGRAASRRARLRVSRTTPPCLDITVTAAGPARAARTPVDLAGRSSQDTFGCPLATLGPCSTPTLWCPAPACAAAAPPPPLGRCPTARDGSPALLRLLAPPCSALPPARREHAGAVRRAVRGAQ